MALTTLIGLLAMSAAPKQQPVQITIETKVCQVVEGSLELRQVTMDILPLTKATSNPNVVLFRNFDEAKLLKNKSLKILSSPVIRTLDSMKAELSTQLTNGTEEIWKTIYTPYVRKDALLDLDIKLSAAFKDDPAKSWEFINKSKVHPGEPIAFLFTKDKKSMIYIIKAHIGDSSRPRS